MRPQSFIADSIPEVLTLVRNQLGPKAVVLNVRTLPVDGLARLWQKPKVEIMAYLEEPAPVAPQETPEFSDLRLQLREIRGRLDQFHQPSPQHPADRQVSTPTKPYGDWRVGAWLEKTGILPIHAHRVVEKLLEEHGAKPPQSFATELGLARQTLELLWPKPARQESNVHIFLGPPGSGKTTALCKWLAMSVIMENRLARVLRLDGVCANTAESLSVYGEIFGVPVERSLLGLDKVHPAECVFVDYPGLTWQDDSAMGQMAKDLAHFPGAQIHLVLNAAYETTVLLSQLNGFSRLGLTDLILTHLDEEQRWGKIWNLVLGTNFTVSRLSAGQNIPGEFLAAESGLLLNRQFP